MNVPILQMGTEKSRLRSCDCLLNQDSNPGSPDPESVLYSTHSPFEGQTCVRP